MVAYVICHIMEKKYLRTKTEIKLKINIGKLNICLFDSTEILCFIRKTNKFLC